MESPSVVEVHERKAVLCLQKQTAPCVIKLLLPLEKSLAVLEKVPKCEKDAEQVLSPKKKCGVCFKTVVVNLRERLYVNETCRCYIKGKI